MTGVHGTSACPATMTVLHLRIVQDSLQGQLPIVATRLPAPRFQAVPMRGLWHIADGMPAALETCPLRGG